MREQDGTPLGLGVAALAGRQWGVISVEQLRALGMARSRATRWIEAGRLHRVHRGVYAVGHARLGREGRRLAAVMACGPGAVLSHVTAASHLELLHTDSALIHVTAPLSRERAQGVRLHRSRSLDAQDTTHHRGIPTTTVHRTLLDLAATVKPSTLERALAQAERLQLFDLRALHDVIDRTNGHRGRGVLTQAIARDPRFTRSDLEAWCLQIARAADLPEPLTNFILAAPDYPRIEVDLCWPTHRLIVELDSWQFHKTRRAFEEDRRRDAALQAAGWRVLRFTGHERRDTVEHRLRAMLA